MAQADAKSKTETKPAKRQRGRPVGSGKDAAIVRSRILRCFADLTSRHGITAVSLSRLASELGMSIATIYKHFANKEELVDATVAEWVDKYRAANIDYKKFKGVKTFEEGFQVWAKGWAEQLGEFSELFWEDMKKNYPPIWEKFNSTLMETHLQGRSILEPFVRQDINHDLVFEMFLLLFEHASKPEVAERHGLTRKQAAETAAQLWASGALVDFKVNTHKDED